MELRVILPDEEPPQTLKEITSALRAAKLKPELQNKDWGDWIHFSEQVTVISIASTRGLTSSATIEYEEDDWDFVQKLLKVFSKKGWMGDDQDGPYPL